MSTKKIINTLMIILQLFTFILLYISYYAHPYLMFIHNQGHTPIFYSGKALTIEMCMFYDHTRFVKKIS